MTPSRSGARGERHQEKKPPRGTDTPGEEEKGTNKKEVANRLPLFPDRGKGKRVKPHEGAGNTKRKKQSQHKNALLKKPTTLIQASPSGGSRGEHTGMVGCKRPKRTKKKKRQFQNGGNRFWGGGNHGGPPQKSDMAGNVEEQTAKPRGNHNSTENRGETR